MGLGDGGIFAIYVAGGITGAHINPAVTIAFAVFGGFAWKKVPGYIVAQILGGVAGAALVYAVYRDSIQAYESQNSIVRDGGEGSIGIFVTGPADISATTGDRSSRRSSARPSCCSSSSPWLTS